MKGKDLAMQEEQKQIEANQSERGGGIIIS